MERDKKREPKTRTLYVRLPTGLADKLELISLIEGTPVSQQIREAVASHIETVISAEDYPEKFRKFNELLENMVPPASA